MVARRRSRSPLHNRASDVSFAMLAGGVRGVIAFGAFRVFEAPPRQDGGYTLFHRTRRRAEIAPEA
jgi:hypothetical protein